MKYIALIPAYEPNDKMIELLKTIPDNMEAVVVDDGSGKEYYDIFEDAKKYAHVISYMPNMGKGHALKEGIKHIKENYQEYIVVTMDCDMQHEITDALKLCNYVNENPNVLALGKRNWDRSMPLRSRFGNTLTRNVFRWFTGQKIYDTQTGLRAFSYQLTDYMLSISGDRYEYEMNVLLNLKAKHIKYYEIPIRTIYIDNNKGSHFNPFKDSIKVYKAILNCKKTR